MLRSQTITFFALLVFLLDCGLSTQPGFPAPATLRLQKSHLGKVQVLAFSPDGKTVASGCDSGEVKMWDTQSGRVKASYFAGRNKIYTLKFSPDGNTLAMPHPSRTWTFQDVLTGQRGISFVGKPDEEVATLTQSPDYRFVAYKTNSGPVTLWDVAARTPGPSLEKVPTESFHWVFSKDSQSFAAQVGNNTAIFWDVHTGKVKNRISSPGEGNKSFYFAPDLSSVIVRKEQTIELWNVSSGKLVATFPEPYSLPDQIIFSPDSQYFAMTVEGKALTIWDANSATLIKELKDSTDHIRQLSYSPDGKLVIVVTSDNIAKIWQVQTDSPPQKLLDVKRTLGFSRDGKRLLLNGQNNIRLWDTHSGVLRGTFWSMADDKPIAALSPDGKTLVTGYSFGLVQFWDVPSGKHRSSSGISNGSLWHLSLAADQKSLVYGYGNGFVFRDIHSGLLRHNPKTFTRTRPITFFPDAALAVVNASGGASLWSTKLNKATVTLQGVGEANKFLLLPDRKSIISNGPANVSLWDVRTGTLKRSLPRRGDQKSTIALSPKGETLAIGQENGTIELWETKNWTRKYTITVGSKHVVALAYSPNGRTLAAGFMDGTIALWNVTSKKRMNLPVGHGRAFTTLVFSPDNNNLASAGSGLIRVWDPNSQTHKYDLDANLPPPRPLEELPEPNFATFTGDSKVLITDGIGNNIHFSCASNGKRLFTMYSIAWGEYVIADASGRFDGTERGLKQLHYVARAPEGLEPVGLEQIKDLYWEPELWRKALASEPLKVVPQNADIPLPPVLEVNFSTPDSSHVQVQVKVRDGGNGPIEAYVNGVRFREDIRPTNNPIQYQPGDSYKFDLDLSTAPTFSAGQTNEVSLIARVKEGWLRSRAIGVHAPVLPLSAPKTRRFFALIAGVSEYADPRLNLYFAAQDAQFFASAIEKAAEAYPGFSSSRILRLASPKFPGSNLLTKANLRAALNQIRAQAGPDDVVLIYLAGHGLALGDTDTQYLYLTRDAVSADPLQFRQNQKFRDNSALSSLELARYLSGQNGIRARHRLVILDTCGAGAAASDLSRVRQLDSDIRISIDRFNEATGTFLLMGSAADRVSYESSRYRQGLLTYALLHGMKGPALRHEQFLDVQTLFEYARNQVPVLASGAGGIQLPLFQPPPTPSFDFGRVTPQIKGTIQLATPLPQLLQPRLADETDGDDELEIEKALRKALRLAYTSAIQHRSMPGVIPLKNAAYVEANTFDGALKPVGLYKRQGTIVKVTLHIKRSGKILSTLHATRPANQLAELTKDLVQKLDAAIPNL